MLNKLYDNKNNSQAIDYAAIDIRGEINSYLNHQVKIDDAEEARKMGALYFYKYYGHRYPALSEVAKCVFSATVSSVPSECLFSQVGLIQNDLRNRLKPALLEKLTIIKQYR